MAYPRGPISGYPPAGTPDGGLEGTVLGTLFSTLNKVLY